jgi:hypothetical protein
MVENQTQSVPDYLVIEAMRRYGGGFVHAFAEAYARADSDNQLLLQPVFAKYRATYAAAVVENEAMRARGNR